MSQVDIFMTDEETESLWVYLSREHEVVAVPDRSKTAEFVALRSIQDLRMHRESFPGSSLYHLSSTQWGPYRPLVNEGEAPGEYPFRLQTRYGGPHVLWTMARESEGPEGPYLVPSMIADYSSYSLRPGAAGEIRRSEAQGAAFRKIRAMLRRGAVSSRARRAGFEGPLVSRGARDFYSRGGWLRIGDEHFDPAEMRGA